MADVRKAAEGPKCGSTGTGTTSHYLPTLLNDGIGTKFHVVTGYPGGPEIDLAVERNEVQCRSFTIAGWFTGDLYANWRKTGFARAVVQSHRKRDARLADVPTVYELLDEFKAPEQIKKLASLLIASNSFGRPYVLPPATPPEYVKIPARIASCARSTIRNSWPTRSGAASTSNTLRARSSIGSPRK